MARKFSARWLAVAMLAAAVAALAVWQLWCAPARPLGDRHDLAALGRRGDLNLIFILIDTLRADHLGAYGYERATSPNLDRLAGSGVRFAHVRSQSTWTKASMASLWSGSYPSRTGILRYQHALPERARLPAEELQAAGFRTTGIWRNGWVANNFGFAQGFDAYFRPAPSRTAERFARRNPSAHPLQGTDLDVTRTALEFLRAYRDRRFFLYLHYMDVHQYLYEQESAKFGTQYMDAYDNAIHWVDRNLEALVDELSRLGLFENTLIAIGSDHGEAFYEHGSEGHARDLYREVTEVPWVLVLPFRLREGIVVEPLVQNVDIWPTLFELLGVEPTAPQQGQSLVPLIVDAAGGEAEGASRLAERAAFAQLDQTWGRMQTQPRPLLSITRGGFRLIHSLADPARDELFDHRSDPTEQHNLLAAHPDLAAELRQEIRAHLAGSKLPGGEPVEVELDALHLEQLRALGYVVGED